MHKLLVLVDKLRLVHGLGFWRIWELGVTNGYKFENALVIHCTTRNLTLILTESCSQVNSFACSCRIDDVVDIFLVHD